MKILEVEFRPRSMVNGAAASLLGSAPSASRRSSSNGIRMPNCTDGAVPERARKLGSERGSDSCACRTRSYLEIIAAWWPEETEYMVWPLGCLTRR